MVEPIEDFEKWFNVTGAWHQDPVTGNIIVAKGRCTLLKNTESLPYKFERVADTFLLNKTILNLEGCPREVPGDFGVGEFWGKNLVGGPLVVKGSYSLKYNPHLESFEGLAIEIGGVLEFRYKPGLPLLQTLVASGGINMFMPTKFNAPLADKFYKTNAILKKYAGQGKRAIFDCQKDLEDSGLEEHARW